MTLPFERRRRRGLEREKITPAQLFQVFNMTSDTLHTLTHPGKDFFNNLKKIKMHFLNQCVRVLLEVKNLTPTKVGELLGGFMDGEDFSSAPGWPFA